MAQDMILNTCLKICTPQTLNTTLESGVVTENLRCFGATQVQIQVVSLRIQVG